MSKLVKTTKKELFNIIVEGLNETEKTFLSGKNKDVNKSVLQRLIDEKYENELFAEVKATVIADGIKDDFIKQAVQGQVYKLIYIGGIDVFERSLPVDRRQSGLFYDIEEGEFVEYTVWGRYPGFRETDPFLAGHLYEIEIVPNVREYNGETRTFYNLRKYTLIEDRTEFISDIILNTKELGFIIEEAADGEFTEATVNLLAENLKYQTTPFKFEVLSVRPIGMTERIESTNEDGATVYSNVPVREKNPNTGAEEVVSMPFVTTTDTGNTTITCSITGKVSLKDDKEIVYFGTFYPSRMGQYFVDSEIVKTAVSNDKFLNQDPEKQADYLKYLLVGKEFVGIGNVRRVESNNDPSKLNMNINMLALVQA